MKLNLIDELVLLALDDDKGTFVSNSLSFGYGMAGAILFQLYMDGNIEILDKKVKIKEGSLTGDKALDFGLEKIIKSKKERSLKHWINKLGDNANHIQEATVNKLVSLDILALKEEKILWIFSNNKFPTKNETPENGLRLRLKEIIFNNKVPELNDVMLVSLVDSCELNNEVFGKLISKETKKRIKDIISNENMPASFNDSIKEIHDQIIAALLVIMISTTVITINN